MSYTRPDGSAVGFTLTGYTAPTGSSVQARFPSSSYTAPTGNSVTAQFGAAYTRPAGNAVDFEWVPSVPEAVVSFSIGISVEATAEHDDVVVEGVGEFTIEVSAEGEGAHGVSGTSAFSIDVSAESEGAHGITGTASFSIDISAAAVAQHPRYMLKGEVRDAGVLVNRMVRAYRRSDGALIGEQLTDAGRFNIHAGFAAAEHYLLPIDLDSGATDFTPPAVNRVMSVLAED